MSVRVSFEIGHEASIRTKKTVEGFTHDWEVYVRGCDGTQLPYFVEKVVFYLHETFPNPKRVIKQPPYVVKESGYAGFVLPIEIYIKHDPKRVKFQYDLTLQTSGPAVRNLQKESYVFRNPIDELKSCLIKGGGVIVNSSSVYDGVDSRISQEPKNELVNKPKLSGADMAMKKHRNRMDDQRSSNSFQDLFGTPITKTNKVFSDPKSASKEPSMTKTTPSGLNSSNSKLDKDRDKSRDKNKLSPSKEREKDRDKDVDKRKSDKIDSERRKERDEKKNKEKSRDRAHSKEKIPKREKSPRPPSPKRPPSPPPIRYKEKEEKRGEAIKDRERKEKSDEKSDKRAKKEKREKEHKENKSREREPPKPNEHKEHKVKEKNREMSKEAESPSSKKMERKEKKEKELKDDKEDNKISTPEMEKKLEKEKHKHKKKDKEKKEKDRDKKREKSKEKEKPVIKKEVEPPKQTEIKEEKESLFAPAKTEEKKKSSHSLFSEEHSNSSLSSKDDSFPDSSSQRADSLFEPSTKKSKLDSNEKSKKEKSKKSKDKKAEKEEKRKKRKMDREQSEEPPQKETKPEDSRPEPSDSEQSPPRPQNDVDKENQENPEEYMEVLKDLQTKIVNLRDNTELQRVVQLIAQTGRYEVSQNTFDFDLCLLEKSTVKQLQEFFASS